MVYQCVRSTGARTKLCRSETRRIGCGSGERPRSRQEAKVQANAYRGMALHLEDTQSVHRWQKQRFQAIGRNIR